MGGHVERCPCPPTAGGAASQKFAKFPIPSTSRPPVQAAPPTRPSAHAFHRHVVGGDRGRGVDHPEADHQVTRVAAYLSPRSVRMVSGGGGSVWSLPRRCMAESCSKAFSTTFSAMPQRRRASSSSSP